MVFGTIAPKTIFTFVVVYEREPSSRITAYTMAESGYGSSFRPVNEGFGDDSVPAIGSRSDRHQPIEGTADAREHIVSEKPFDFPAVSELLPQKYWLRVDTDRVGSRSENGGSEVGEKSMR